MEVEHEEDGGKNGKAVDDTEPRPLLCNVGELTGL